MSEVLNNHVIAQFSAQFGSVPDGVAFAPGRINLIGEHVDYNDGIVLPMPVRQGTAIAWSATESGDVEAFAADLDASDAFALADPQKPAAPAWNSYVRGMAAFAPVAPKGIKLAISGDLPRGSGLSSSASLCIALGRAFAEAGGSHTDPISLAKSAQRTEHEYAGVACGIMDQMAIAAGSPGKVLQLDCRDLTYEQIALPDDWAVVTVASGVTRGLVDGEYNLRREQCEAAARAMGEATLRDARMSELAHAAIDQTTANRARHVIEEIARVRDAAKAIREADLAALGALLREGHASLRDLFEVSVAPVDDLVDRLNELIGPCGGARMTGAGFGGSVVAVFERARFDALQSQSQLTFTRVR